MDFFKKIGAISLGFFVFLSLTHAASAATGNFYIPDSAITIDGVTDDWGAPLISDGEDNKDRTRHCWNTSAKTWEKVTDEESCETYLFDEEGQIDLIRAWFGANEKNMLLAFETASHMFSIRDVANDTEIPIFDMNKLSQIGIDSLPDGKPFSHNMVFAFDTTPTDEKEVPEWYMIANMDYNIPMEEQMDQSDFLQIWKEEGTTVGFQEDQDTEVTSIDTSLSEVSSDDPSTAASPVMEIRQNIEKFYEVTGIKVGDTVGFSLSTQSSSGDTTKQVLVSFRNKEETNLPSTPTLLKAKKIGTTSALLTWKKSESKEKIRKYVVEVRKSGEADRDLWKKYKNLKKVNVLAKKLTAGAAYEFRVTACNKNGCGDSSKWLKFTTKE